MWSRFNLYSQKEFPEIRLEALIVEHGVFCTSVSPQGYELTKSICLAQLNANTAS